MGASNQIPPGGEEKEMEIAAYHSIDPQTGYLQTTGNYAEALTPERKDQWLKAYKASGLRFRSTCTSLGISHHTINHHIEIDPVFKQNYQEAQAEYAEELEARQRNYALEPKHFMDRAMQLRALLPGKYARDERRDDNQITINISADIINEAKRRSEALEAKIIDVQRIEETRLKALPPQGASASMMAEVLPMRDDNTESTKTVDNQQQRI